MLYLGPPWTSFVAALDKGQCNKAVCRRHSYWYIWHINEFNSQFVCQIRKNYRSKTSKAYLAYTYKPKLKKALGPSSSSAADSASTSLQPASTTSSTRTFWQWQDIFTYIFLSSFHRKNKRRRKQDHVFCCSWAWIYSIPCQLKYIASSLPSQYFFSLRHI